MSDIKPNFLVICNGPLGMPAIAFLQSQNCLCAIASSTRDLYFEQELIAFSNNYHVELALLEKSSWKKGLQELLTRHQPDVVLVKTFEFKIPSEFLSIPRLGFINFHYALLPQYRGVFPLFEILKSRKPFGGVSVHHMTAELDKGNLIFQQYVPIQPPELYGKHLLNLAHEGARLTMQLLEYLSDTNASLPSLPQDEKNARVLSKPGLKDLWINWNSMSADEIIALIMASNPWSKGAVTTCRNFPFHILYARKGNSLEKKSEPGTVITINENEGVTVTCLNNESIVLDIVYMPDGYIPAFMLKTRGISIGDVLGT